MNINPERIAAKHNFARPENPSGAGERIWFLQAMSMQPGGLDAFVARLIEEFPHEFQTKAMQETGVPSSGSYNLQQCITVWQSIAKSTGDHALVRMWSREKAQLREQDLSAHEAAEVSFDAFIICFVGPDTTPADAAGDSPYAAALRSGFERFNFAWLKDKCVSLAKERLARYLTDLCQEARSCYPHYCPNLDRLLTSSMQKHAENVRSQLADTVVTRTIFQELEFAYSEGVPVPFVGESRFGKTKSLVGCCAAYPGRLRIVTVPDSNREIDFIRAHADGLGIDYTPATPAGVLKDKVEFVLKRSGLMVVYDEAHYLIPTSYHKATPPRRLNWVRSKVIDQGVPCAFFATPQSYQQTLEKYVTTTGYRMEQWLGRMSPAVILSEVIPFEEIVAVARKHFPELPEVLLEEIADRAILSDGHLKNVELAGKRARFLARQRDHAIPTKQDVFDAIEAMMPAQPRVVSHTPDPGAAASLPVRSVSPAASRQTDSAEDFSSRGTNTRTLIPEPELVH